MARKVKAVEHKSGDALRGELIEAGKLVGEDLERYKAYIKHRVDVYKACRVWVRFISVEVNGLKKNVHINNELGAVVWAFFDAESSASDCYNYIVEGYNSGGLDIRLDMGAFKVEWVQQIMDRFAMKAATEAIINTSAEKVYYDVLDTIKNSGLAVINRQMEMYRDKVAGGKMLEVAEFRAVVEAIEKVSSRETMLMSKDVKRGVLKKKLNKAKEGGSARLNAQSIVLEMTDKGVL